VLESEHAAQQTIWNSVPCCSLVKNDDVMNVIVVFCILFVFMLVLVLYCFCVATEFSVNKDLYIRTSQTAHSFSCFSLLKFPRYCTDCLKQFAEHSRALVVDSLFVNCRLQ